MRNRSAIARTADPGRTGFSFVRGLRDLELVPGSMTTPSAGSNGAPGRSDDGQAPLRVLVVEGGVRTSRLLRQAKGAPVVCSVPDAERAAKSLAGQCFDAVVVELPISHGTADDVYRAVRGLDPRHTERLIFLVADLIDTSVQRFLTRAGRPFLTRPVDGDELYEVVHRIARPSD